MSRGGAEDEEAITLDEEYERVREFDGVLAPDRELEGDIEIGSRVEGEANISLVFLLSGIGIKEGFIGGSIVSQDQNRRASKPQNRYRNLRVQQRGRIIAKSSFLGVSVYLFQPSSENGEGKN